MTDDKPPIPSLGACRGGPAIPLTGARQECECILCGAVVAAGANQKGWFRAMCERYAKLVPEGIGAEALAFWGVGTVVVLERKSA